MSTVRTNVLQSTDEAFDVPVKGIIRRVDTIAQLKLIEAPWALMAVEVTEEGRGGLFVFDVGATGTADDGITFKADDATVGSWVRRYQGPVNIYWYDVDPTDASAALTAALAVGDPVIVPYGELLIDNVIASNIRLSGAGVIRKKAATKGKMLELSGDNLIEGLTFDYDWQNRTDAAPYWADVAVWLDGGSLSIASCRFTRTLAAGVRTQGGSLKIQSSTFDAGALHNNLGGGNERVTQYVFCQATAAIPDNAYIQINDCRFIGPNSVPADNYLNPGGIFINADGIDGALYKSVVVADNSFQNVGQNAGALENKIGAIDTYNGAENCSIVGNVIRNFSYAGIKLQNSENLTVIGNVCEGGYSGPLASVPDQAYGIMVQERQRSATTERHNVCISANVIDSAGYAGILSNVDNAIIKGNVVRGVAVGAGSTATGIWNLNGNRVSIADNIVVDNEGIGIASAGSDVSIVGNVVRNANGTNGILIFFSGARSVITGNNCANPTTSPTNPAIRTNGPANNISIASNVLSDVSTGIDLRVTGGAVNNVELGRNSFEDVTTPYLINASVTAVRNAQGIGQAIVPDNGDAAATLDPKISAPTQVWNTPLTANRNASLLTTGALAGHRFRVVRTAAATGAFTLNVGSGPLKALGIGEWCIVEYTGTAWMLVAFGAL